MHYAQWGANTQIHKNTLFLYTLFISRRFYFILFRVNLREKFYFNNVPIYGYHIGIITKIAKSDYRKPPDLVQNHESYCWCFSGVYQSVMRFVKNQSKSWKPVCEMYSVYSNSCILNNLCLLLQILILILSGLLSWDLSNRCPV